MRRYGLRRAALAGVIVYLAVGSALYPYGNARSKTRLPAASLPLTEIERRNGHTLEVAHKGPEARSPKTGPKATERLLPDLRTLEPNDVYTVGSRAEGSLRLKFATTVWNAGRGPLETRGATNPETDALEVYQFVYTPAGRARRGRQVGTFNYDHRHGHLHFDDFARYELWSVDDAGRRVALVADNAKVGFCLMDIKHIGSGRVHLESGLVDRPGGPVYAGCREDVQGISVGWGDEYLSLLYEQDLELSGVPDGAYALVVTANPDEAIEELNYGNNAGVTYLTLQDDRVVWSSDEEPQG